LYYSTIQKPSQMVGHSGVVKQPHPAGTPTLVL
jgi:hypothetical protein